MHKKINLPLKCHSETLRLCNYINTNTHLCLSTKIQVKIKVQNNIDLEKKKKKPAWKLN